MVACALAPKCAAPKLIVPGQTTENTSPHPWLSPRLARSFDVWSATATNTAAHSQNRISKNIIAKLGLRYFLEYDSCRMFIAVKSVNRFSVRAAPKLKIKYVPVNIDDWVSNDIPVVLEPGPVNRGAISPYRMIAKTKGVTSATATNWRHTATSPA